ncbi:hypothetical protein HpBT107_09270 [Helicobacter pylori]
MKADAMKLLDFIGKSQEKQFVIPIYRECIAGKRSNASSCGMILSKRVETIK